MAKIIEREIENFGKTLKLHGEKTLCNLLSAFLIWLFGVLIFIPLAGSINRETEILCNLIFFSVFTFLVVQSLPGLKEIVDSFSVLIAKRCELKKGLNFEKSMVVFRRFSYIILIIVFYLFYAPLLMRFHSLINGVTLLLALIWIFYLIISILPILFTEVLKWFSYEK